MLRTEKAVSKKEVYTEVERVVVCHGLGDVALKFLTLGAFPHSARTAPIITLFILGTPLKTTHLQKDV